MGLFNFGSKEAVKVSAYKISTGMFQIQQELLANGQQITPTIRGLATAIKAEVLNLEKHLKPNGRTDWDLYNSTKVKVHSGETIDFCTFEARVNNMSEQLERMSGITNIYQLNQPDSISFRIWS
ncbi:hypothetical protein [Dysgonomonas termitidis]|uniref:Uncharacterized protein n=1 Tax=Dysgonomonas termitidis TaxID=1516126 RepID=A0ABV9L356_9BACT